MGRRTKIPKRTTENPNRKDDIPAGVGIFFCREIPGRRILEICPLEKSNLTQKGRVQRARLRKKVHGRLDEMDGFRKGRQKADRGHLRKRRGDKVLQEVRVLPSRDDPQEKEEMKRCADAHLFFISKGSLSPRLPLRSSCCVCRRRSVSPLKIRSRRRHP